MIRWHFYALGVSANDNARQFIGTEFKAYCIAKGITLNNTIPYWTQQNGDMERQNRSLLKRLKISQALQRNWKENLNQYLMMYTTGTFRLWRIVRRCNRSTAEHGERDNKGSVRQDKRCTRVRPGKAGYIVLLKQQTKSGKLDSLFSPERLLQKYGYRATVQSTTSGKLFQRNTAHTKKIENACDESRESK